MTASSTIKKREKRAKRLGKSAEMRTYVWYNGEVT